jgi:hypothetical protein
MLVKYSVKPKFAMKSSLASSNGKSGNSGGSGGAPKKPPGNGKEWWRDIYENPQQYLWLGIAAGVGAGWLIFNSSGGYSHEINWQEFRTNYLAKGEVSTFTFSKETTEQLNLIKMFFTG